MNLTTNYEIAIANFVVAMGDDAVSTEEREALREAVGEDTELLMDVINVLTDGYDKKQSAGKMDTDKAEAYITAEYKAIGLTELLDYKYVKPLVRIYLDRGTLFAGQFDSQAIFSRVVELFNGNKDCPMERFRDGVNMFCLRLLSRIGCIGYDVSLTKQIMKELNQLTEERKEAAILPNGIVETL